MNYPGSQYLRSLLAMKEQPLNGCEMRLFWEVLNQTIGVGRQWAFIERSQLKQGSWVRGKDEVRLIRNLQTLNMLLVEETPEGTRYATIPPERWSGSPFLTKGDRYRLDQAIALANGREQFKLPNFVPEDPSLSSLMSASNDSTSGGEEYSGSTPGEGRQAAIGQWITGMKDAADGFGPAAELRPENRASGQVAASATPGCPKIGQAGVPSPENRDPIIGTRLSGAQVPELQPPENRAAPALASAYKAKLLAEAKAGSDQARGAGLLLEVERECPYRWAQFRETWRRMIEADPDYVEFSLLKRLHNERREGREVRNGAAWMSRIARDDGRYPKPAHAQ